MLLKKLIFIIVLFIIMTPLFSIKVEAISNVIYISPSSTSVNQGNAFSVQLRIDPSSQINAVSANVNYNQGILQFNSLSLGAFSLCTTDSGGGGVVQINCAYQGSSNYPSSDSLIAVINFQAIGPGSSSLNITNANAINPNNYQYTYPSVSNASVYSNGLTPTPGPINSGPTRSSSSYSSYYNQSNNNYPSSSSNSSNSSSTQPIATPSNKTGPIIKKIAQNIYFSIGNIDISSNIASTGLLKFGTSKNNLNQQISITQPSANLSFNLNNSNLTPGTKYYYQIVLSASNSANYTSKINSFTTKGLNLNMLVMDKAFHPIPNLKVVIHSSHPIILKTNSSGLLNISNISPGFHHLVYQYKNKSYSVPIYIINNVQTIGNYQNSPTQTNAVILTDYHLSSGLNGSNVILIIGFILIIFLISLASYIFMKRPKFLDSIEVYRDMTIKSNKK